MSQHDFDIANQGFPATRADLNNALKAAASNSAGTSAPSTTYAYQFWYDSTNNIIKMRNGDNDAWISVATVDQTNDLISITHTGMLDLVDDDGSASIRFQAPSTVTSTTTFTLPDGDGDSGQTLITNGSGTLSWHAPYGNRNLIINGSCAISQRGTSSVTSGYFLDRWTISSASATAQLTSSLPDGFGFGLSVSATSGNPVAAQKIEAKNCKHLVGKKVTLSFYAKDLGNVAQLYASLGTANSEDNFGATTTISEQTLIADLPTSWAIYSYTWTLPANAANGIILNILCAGSGTFTMGITGVQLEVGEQATPFEHRSFGDELARCQRYFQKSYNYGTDPGSATEIGAMYNRIDSSVSNRTPNITFPVEMRSATTITLYSLNGTAGAVSDCATGFSHSSNVTGSSFSGTDGTRGISKLSLGTSKDDIVGFHYTAEAEL